MASTAVAIGRPSLAEICSELRGRSAEVDRQGRFSRGNWRLLVESGFTGMAVPLEFGGGGAEIPELLEAFRAFGAACPSTGLCFVMHSCATSVISAVADYSVKQSYLRRVANDGLIAAYAGTESGTGTNFWALESCAIETGEGFALNLRKSWATLAEAADVFVIPTRAQSDAEPTEISLFLVEREEGVSANEPWRGLGMRGTSSGPVSVNAVVPFRRLMGVAGRANEYITTDMFNLLLLSHAALYTGIAEEALALSTRHAERRVFPHTGEALAHTSLWQAQIGHLSTEVHAGIALLESAGREAARVDSQGRLLKSALAAKINGCSLARRATDFAMQISGGSGYNQGERVEMLWRDARAGSLMRPSDEVAQMILGRMECGLEAFPS